MSKEFIVKLPKLGESITSATIVKWFKQEGDFVKLDEPLLEVSTDKVNSEIPSPVQGVIAKWLGFENQELDVGAGLCIIHTDVAGGSVIDKTAEVEAPSNPSSQEATTRNDFLSPAVLKIAQARGINYDDFKKIKGTGEGGRITKRDVEAYTPSFSRPHCTQAQIAEVKGERIKMDPMRKAIADNMVKSFYTAPHASLIDTLDVTPILDWIEMHKGSFAKENGVKISLTAFIALALAKALKAYPLLNSQVHGDEIVLRESVNLGLAVSVGAGLVVPVIAHAEEMNLVKMALSIADKAVRAREGKLLPSEVKEGSFTLTNFGMGGVQIGMPIIRFPEVAILAVGTISKAVLPLSDGSIGIRSVVQVTLTFDHRVVDGLYGCAFLNAFKTALESLIQ